MARYVQEILDTSGVTGTARTPASDTLFDADESALVSEPLTLTLTMTEYLIRINPKYNEFRQRNGTITVLLKKALYGCVESASL
jgi:hypothetical protein